jgi:Cysteine sulfinate desulfinase/cysteine desulfurase and related enzymes
MLYLDAAATTPVRREAIEAAWPYLTAAFGNPSSRHGIGEVAARALADARAEIAGILGCRTSEIVFASGGTEADNLAVKGIALGDPRGRHLVTAATEHEAVLESIDHLRRLHGFDVTFVEVDETGLVTPDALAAALRTDTALVSIAYANNEIGTVQPIAELAALAHERGIPLHTDAVQAAGWLDLDRRRLDVDALSIAGHKVGAPRGIGLLYVRGGMPLEPVLHGGGQERGRRSGTENVAGAVAFATALRLAEAERTAAHATEKAAVDRDAFIERVLGNVPGARLTGHPSLRLAAHASFVFPYTGGEVVLLELERRGVIVSSGSACAAGSDEPSHVLIAIGIPDAVARTAVRFSWVRGTTSAQLMEAADAVRDSVAAVAGLSR